MCAMKLIITIIPFMYCKKYRCSYWKQRGYYLHRRSQWEWRVQIFENKYWMKLHVASHLKKSLFVASNWIVVLLTLGWSDLILFKTSSTMFRGSHCSHSLVLAVEGNKNSLFIILCLSLRLLEMEVNASISMHV